MKTADQPHPRKLYETYSDQCMCPGPGRRGVSDFHHVFTCFSYGFICFSYDFILFVTWLYMFFTWFYMILHCFYMIFGGVAEIFGWPVFLNLNIFPDFERSTGNSKYHRNFQMTRFSEFERFFWILNVRPEIRSTTEIFGWPVFLNLNVFSGFWTSDRKFQVPPNF